MKNSARFNALRIAIIAIMLLPVAGTTSSDVPAQSSAVRLLTTNSMGSHISIVAPDTGDVEQFEVGPAPWGIALTGDGRAFVSTATAVAVFDLESESVIATVPYLTAIGEAGFGEYRAGGMGIVASPDGQRVHVGVHVDTGPGWLETLNTETLEFESRVQVGVRPFDVIISPDGGEVYSIDHDSFTVTVVDTRELDARTIDVAPLGYGGFDKPHYAKVLADGRILLPYQGKLMLVLDPDSGESTTWPLTSDSHMHGIATNAEETCGAIVGTGPAGSASGPPSLTLFDPNGAETVVLPLEKPHEMAAITDDCATAYLSGGYTFANGGWDGISVVDLESGAVTEMTVPNRPLWLTLLPSGSP
jgi:DNA-binding beta-propeller fold protein YncE